MQKLRKIGENIREVALNAVGATNEHANKKPIIEGQLNKLATKSHSKWDQRDFVLYNDSLAYYVDSTSEFPKGELRLSPEYFVADSMLRNHCFQVSDLNNVYYIAADTDEEKLFWMHTIARVIRNMSQVVTDLPVHYVELDKKVEKYAAQRPPSMRASYPVGAAPPPPVPAVPGSTAAPKQPPPPPPPAPATKAPVVAEPPKPPPNAWKAKVAQSADSTVHASSAAAPEAKNPAAAWKKPTGAPASNSWIKPATSEEVIHAAPKHHKLHQGDKKEEVAHAAPKHHKPHLNEQKKHQPSLPAASSSVVVSDVIDIGPSSTAPAWGKPKPVSGATGGHKNAAVAMLQKRSEQSGEVAHPPSATATVLAQNIHKPVAATGISKEAAEAVVSQTASTSQKPVSYAAAAQAVNKPDVKQEVRMAARPAPPSVPLPEHPAPAVHTESPAGPVTSSEPEKACGPERRLSYAAMAAAPAPTTTSRPTTVRLSANQETKELKTEEAPTKASKKRFSHKKDKTPSVTVEPSASVPESAAQVADPTKPRRLSYSQVVKVVPSAAVPSISPTPPAPATVSTDSGDVSSKKAMWQKKADVHLEVQKTNVFREGGVQAAQKAALKPGDAGYGQAG